MSTYNDTLYQDVYRDYQRWQGYTGSRAAEEARHVAFLSLEELDNHESFSRPDPEGGWREMDEFEGSYEMPDPVVHVGGQVEPKFVARKRLVALSIKAGKKVRAAVKRCRSLAQLYKLIDGVIAFDDYLDELLGGRAAMPSLWNYVSKACSYAERRIRKRMARRPAGLSTLHAKPTVNQWLRGRKKPIRIDTAMVAFDALRMTEKRTVAKAVLGLVPIDKLSGRPLAFAKAYSAAL